MVSFSVDFKDAREAQIGNRCVTPHATFQY